MGIFERLGTLIGSYFSENRTGPYEREGAADPELRAAYDELNEYLAGGALREEQKNTVFPEAFRADFAELGVPFGADRKTCRDAYKGLLKLHHPDRHAGHEGNMKKATEKTARVNAAYERIEKQRQDSPGG
jgi:DnaJ-domain-containing protein 1